MAIKDLMKAAKADRYTQDGRDQLNAALQADVEDRTYKTGEISEKTGLQKQPDGSWAPPKKGKLGSGTGKKETGNKEQKRQKHIAANAQHQFEAASETANSEIDQANLKSIKSFMDEEHATFKNALYSKAETLARRGARGTPEPENEKSLLKFAEAAGMADDLKLYLKEEVNSKYEFGGRESKPAEKTTIRQGPNTKTLDETPAEHVQKNVEAYRGYSPYDMEELVLKPSGYKKSSSTKGPEGTSSITYTKEGSEDITIYFDKYGELENAGTGSSREAVMQKMRAAEGYGHMKVIGDYDVYKITSGPDKGKYSVSKVGSAREIAMSEKAAADFLSSATGSTESKPAEPDSSTSKFETDAAPREFTGDCKIRVRKA